MEGAAATQPDASRYLQPVDGSAASGASNDRANNLRVNLCYGSGHKENFIGLSPVEIDPTDHRSSAAEAGAGRGQFSGVPK